MRTLEGDVAFGLDIARQYGWEARDNQDCESASQRDDHCRKDCRAQENRSENFLYFLEVAVNEMSEKFLIYGSDVGEGGTKELVCGSAQPVPDPRAISPRRTRLA